MKLSGKCMISLLIGGSLVLAWAAYHRKISSKQIPVGESPLNRPVLYIELQKEKEETFLFDRNTTRVWAFELKEKPVLARLEAELHHSGFNCPLRVQLNGEEAGTLSVSLPNLRDGDYQFFQVPRPETPDGFSFVADATSWRPAWIFLERPLWKQGTNQIRLSSTLDRLRIRNLKLEVLPELPPPGALDLRPDPEPAALDSDPLVLPALVALQDGALNNFPLPSGIKYTALYFSAHWCGPCRVFTPKLVDWYRQIRAKHPEFQLVFVSADESPEDMLNYMKETMMPWPAVSFNQIKTSGLSKWSADGIPYLILFGPDGRPVSAKNREWRPPQEVMKEIAELLSQGLSSQK